MTLDSSILDRLERYPRLRIAVVGDVFLDRYLHIDPARVETSIETGLPVHNVTGVRAQAGAAGTIIANLSALGVGLIKVVSFRGEDGEGFELERALRALPGTDLEHFLVARDRMTPVYCKPLLCEPGQPPRELNRFDTKNWTKTSSALATALAERVRSLAGVVDAIVVLDQVDAAETGVATRIVLDAVREVELGNPGVLVIADSRRGLGDFPPMAFKMNATELARMNGRHANGDNLHEVMQQVAGLAIRNDRPVFVTLAERGILGAAPGSEPVHVPALPVRGPIDIVGAGDSVTANLTTALAAGCNLRQAMTVAMVASSIVIHQLGTTGTASVPEIVARLDEVKP